MLNLWKLGYHNVVPLRLKDHLQMMQTVTLQHVCIFTEQLSKSNGRIILHNIKKKKEQNKDAKVLLPLAVWALLSLRRQETSLRTSLWPTKKTQEGVLMTQQTSCTQTRERPRHVLLLQMLTWRFTLALSSSTMKWHSEALKKYSLALYFSRGLSMVLIATWNTENDLPFQTFTSLFK